MRKMRKKFSANEYKQSLIKSRSLVIEYLSLNVEKMEIDELKYYLTNTKFNSLKNKLEWINNSLKEVNVSKVYKFDDLLWIKGSHYFNGGKVRVSNHKSSDRTFLEKDIIF